MVFGPHGESHKGASMEPQKAYPLSCLERVVLFNVLPKEGTFGTVRVVRVLREKLEMTPPEKTHHKFKENGTWDKSFETELTEFPFKLRHLEVIRDTLRKLNEEKKLPVECSRMYELFEVEKPTGEDIGLAIPEAALAE
jgi:hypothetical protein